MIKGKEVRLVYQSRVKYYQDLKWWTLEILRFQFHGLVNVVFIANENRQGDCWYEGVWILVIIIYLDCLIIMVCIYIK